LSSELAVDASLDPLQSRVRATAFRMLLETGVPVTRAGLVADLGLDAAEVDTAVADLECRGLIRRDEGSGDVVGSLGLSAVPSRDEILVDGRRLWTWCAKTSLGVLGALGRGGLIVSRSPVSGRELRQAFDGAQPQATGFVVYWPDLEFSDSCSSAVDDLCPNINLFEDAEAADRWARESGVPGEVLSVEDATVRAVEKWGPLVAEAKV
jgi:alkylmercury lyase